MTTLNTNNANNGSQSSISDDESEFLSLISHHHEIDEKKRSQRLNGAIDEESGQVRESLLEYEQALVLTEEEMKTKELNKKKGLQASLAHSLSVSDAGKKPTALRDLIDAMLPPRIYPAPASLLASLHSSHHHNNNNNNTNTNTNTNTTNNQYALQRVSLKPSSRDHVIELQMKLDSRLQERQARENGICPVREELYSQCFDEIIREITLESPERGLLLLRVRDDIKMTLAAYQTLYESSITFGMRKKLEAEQGNAELQKKIEELERDKKKLQAAVTDHRNLYEAIEKRIVEQRALDEKKMQEEKDFLKFQAQHLESFLKSAMH